MKIKSHQDYKPIKIPRNKKYGNNYWTSIGRKVEFRDVTLYSDLEFDHWLTVESDNNVDLYCEQPLEITYVLNGKRHTSIFDMWILYKSGEEVFVEVKYESELNSTLKKHERTKRQIQAQKQWCEQNGFNYEVRTEKNIRNGIHKIANLLKVVSTTSVRNRPTNVDDIYSYINYEIKTILELQTRIHRYSLYEIITATQWLYYEGLIDANINKLIWNCNMEVWRNEQI